MRRRWKVLIGLGVALAILLGVNALITDNETKSAAVTIEGGQILHLTTGDVQVVQEGPRRAQPIVLLHCYGCSLHWWDRLAPLLSTDHRVIRIDLLGFGGSQKPSSGYSISNEANLVAEALGKLHVQGAVVVGHSLGFDVTTALAQSHSELVDRAVDIDEAPDSSFGSLPFVARLGHVPIIGQALYRTAPDVLIKDGYSSAFAPGYDLADGFDNPDQVVDDYHATTYTSFTHVSDAADDFESEEPLDARIRDAAVPLLVIFGTEDQLWDDPGAAADAYRDVPGAQIAMVPGAGHSPNVEKPAETARLIEEFAARAHYRPATPRHHGQGYRGSASQQNQQHGKGRHHRHGHQADRKRKHNGHNQG